MPRPMVLTIQVLAILPAGFLSLLELQDCHLPTIIARITCTGERQATKRAKRVSAVSLGLKPCHSAKIKIEVVDSDNAKIDPFPPIYDPDDTENFLDQDIAKKLQAAFIIVSGQSFSIKVTLFDDYQ